MSFLGKLDHESGSNQTGLLERGVTADVSLLDDLQVAPYVRNPDIERIRQRVQRRREDVNRRRRASDNPRVSVIVPARNEAKNLPIVFDTIPDDVFEIIVVDGDSTDGTAEVARSLRDDVRVIGQTRPGKGNALICGFEAARGDIIVMIDADCSMDGAEIPLYVDALLDGADFVKGSRYLEGAGSSDITHIRSAGNHVLRLMVNGLFGTRYTDLCYGYAAFWRWTLPKLALDCDGFEVETMMNIRAHTAGLNIAEVPTWEHDRIHGESNLNATRDGLRILKVIVSERMAPKRGRRRFAARRARAAREAASTA